MTTTCAVVGLSLYGLIQSDRPISEILILAISVLGLGVSYINA